MPNKPHFTIIHYKSDDVSTLKKYTEDVEELFTNEYFLEEDEEYTNHSFDEYSYGPRNNPNDMTEMMSFSKPQSALDDGPELYAWMSYTRTWEVFIQSWMNAGIQNLTIETWEPEVVQWLVRHVAEKMSFINYFLNRGLLIRQPVYSVQPLSWTPDYDANRDLEVLAVFQTTMIGGANQKHFIEALLDIARHYIDDSHRIIEWEEDPRLDVEDGPLCRIDTVLGYAIRKSYRLGVLALPKVEELYQAYNALRNLALLRGLEFSCMNDCRAVTRNIIRTYSSGTIVRAVTNNFGVSSEIENVISAELMALHGVPAPDDAYWQSNSG